MKVLIVDDSSTIRKIIKNTVKRYISGVQEIFEAENGAIALEILNKNPDIELIFLDWNMPVMDGLTFLKTVRKNEKWSKDKLKIIMVTTETEKSSVINALKHGASNYIAKPFTPQVFMEKLRKIGLI